MRLSSGLFAMRRSNPPGVYLNKNKTGAVLDSRNVLARLRPDIYFKMPKCHNAGNSEVGDPKLATRKETKIGETVDYRRWEHRLSLILA
jgi:hypothetical protein